MALEDLTGTKYIDDLNSSNPAAGDNVSQGDDHIRGIKNVLKTTFPSIDGAITATDTELNYVDGVTSNVQTQFNAITADDWVTSARIADGAVDTARLGADAVTGAKIADNAINSEHYTDGSIDTAHIADDQITTAKIADDVALGGNPTTTTQSASNNSTRIATTAYTDAAIAALADSAPSTLNTLNELAAALGDDANYATTTTNAIAAKMPLAGGTFTGNVTHSSGYLDMAGGAVYVNDSGSFRAGTSEDLKIYHNGTHSFIQDSGTGQLKVISNGAGVDIQKDETETMAKFITDGAVELYHNNVKKFETTAAGATVTGTLTADLADNSINSEHYVDGSIDTAHIADAQITLAKMSTNSVSTNQYVDGSIETAHIGNSQVTLAKLAANSVDSSQYVDGSIDTAHIADDAVTAAKIGNDAINHGDMIADGVIGSEHYADGSIDREHLAADIVDGTKIADNAINSEHYADGSIDNAHIADDAINGAKLVDNAINSEHYTDDSIDNAHLSESLGDLRKGVTHIGRDTNDFAAIGTATHEWHINGSEYMRLNASAELHVDADVIAFSTTISDERLKHDIEPITDALSKVNQLNGVTFTYNADDKKSAGLIAQDVEKVLPSAVSEKELPLKHDDGKEYKVLQYDQTIGLLVEAIKELTAKVEKLEAK